MTNPYGIFKDFRTVVLQPGDLDIEYFVPPSFRTVFGCSILFGVVSTFSLPLDRNFLLKAHHHAQTFGYSLFLEPVIFLFSFYLGSAAINLIARFLGGTGTVGATRAAGILSCFPMLVMFPIHLVSWVIFKSFDVEAEGRYVTALTLATVQGIWTLSLNLTLLSYIQGISRIASFFSIVALPISLFIVALVAVMVFH